MIEFVPEWACHFLQHAITALVGAWLGRTLVRMKSVVRVDSETFVILSPWVRGYAVSSEAFELIPEHQRDADTLYLTKADNKTFREKSIVRPKNSLHRLVLTIRSWGPRYFARKYRPERSESDGH